MFGEGEQMKILSASLLKILACSVDDSFRVLDYGR